LYIYLMMCYKFFKCIMLVPKCIHMILSIYKYLKKREKKVIYLQWMSISITPITKLDSQVIITGTEKSH